MLEEEGNPPAVVDERPLLLLCSIVAKKDDYEMICVAPNENKLKRRNRYVIQVVDMCREPGCITALGVMIGHGSSVVLVDIERDSEGRVYLQFGGTTARLPFLLSIYYESRWVSTMLYHQGLALTILIGQSLSLEAFSSFATLAAKSGSVKRLSSFHTFSRHDLRISNKDAVGIHHNNMSLYIDADDNISVPVDIGLNGDDHSSIVDDAKLENNSPPSVGANNINGHGTILNGNENLSSSSSPPTIIKLESTTPPFPIVLWRFTRPHTIIGSAIAIPSIFLLAAPTYQSFFTIRSLASLLYAVIPALFMNLYITGLNQMTDVEIDKINVSALLSLLIHFTPSFFS